ncbi:MAG TPA: NAD-dependent epimerase/dehydratase family protein [Rhodocyclaceae bacterium]|nr:NAD-dependent epimerase/dehydratase family protein [Rhodocyclaceae bacterium]
MKRILIVGCGDIARRALPWLIQRCRVYALVRRAETADEIRALGAIPMRADLDDFRSLRRIAGLADAVLHFAPPPNSGSEPNDDDPRTRNLLAALASRGSLPRSLVYISTTGVYGDCAGQRVMETQRLAPATARARRRVAAERRLRVFARRNPVRFAILRAPGIYAAERLPLERLKRGDPVLMREEDVYTNHIHADDLAHAAVIALFRGGAGRAYNISDDAHLQMGDYYNAMADIFDLSRPPRLSRAECARKLSSTTMSFMAESRKLDNLRMKHELRLKLKYENVIDGLRIIASQIKKPADLRPEQ